MNTKEQIHGVARELREQALMLQVYHDDEKIARSAARKILVLVKHLGRWQQNKRSVEKLRVAARDLGLAAKLIAIARAPDRGLKHHEAAKLLLGMARDLQNPKRLVTIARRLIRESEGSSLKPNHEPSTVKAALPPEPFSMSTELKVGC